MRKEAILGDAVGAYFGRELLVASDVSGLIVRRANIAPLTLVFVPGAGREGRSAVAIDRRLDPATASECVAVALAHHLLGHEMYDAYVYGPDGPFFPSQEASEAREFAQAFLFAGAMVQPADSGRAADLG